MSEVKKVGIKKRLYSTLIAMLFLIQLFPTYVYAAASDVTISLSANASTVNINNNVTISVIINGTDSLPDIYNTGTTPLGIYGLNAVIDYNSTGFSPQSMSVVSAENPLTGFINALNYDTNSVYFYNSKASAGAPTLTEASDTNGDHSVTMVTITFKAIAAGDYTFQTKYESGATATCLMIDNEENDAFDLPASSAISVHVDAPPAKPTIGTATAADNNSGVTVNWTALGTAPSEYRVYYSNTAADPTTSSPSATFASGATSGTISSLTSGTAYKFAVAGYDSTLGVGTLSDVVSSTPVASPVISSATPSNGSVTLNWSAVTGASSYNVYQSDTELGTYLSVSTGVTGTSTSVTGLTNGTTYYFKMTSLNSGSQESAKSTSAASATPMAGTLLAPNSNPTTGNAITIGDTIDLSAEAGATIRYTVGTTEPDGTSTVFTAPIVTTNGMKDVNGFVKITAKAFQTGYSASSPATFTYPVSVALVANALTNATFGTAYNQSITSATGGSGTYTYSVTAGALPAGITLSPAGALSGTSTALGTSNITIRATDTKNSQTADANYSLTVDVAGVLTAPTASLSIPAATTINIGDTVTLSAQAGATIHYTTDGTAPDMNSATYSGPITTTSGMNSNGVVTLKAISVRTGYTTSTPAATFSYPVKVALNGGTLPSGILNESYSRNITATGGSNSYSYTLESGDLPTGLTLSTAGVLSGTTTEENTFNFRIKATDTNNGQTASADFTMMVSAAYTATINVNINDTASTAPGAVELWQGGGKVADTSTSTTGVYSATIPNGTYIIYINGVNTGETLVILDAANSKDLNYFTVGFNVANAGTASGSTIIATAGGSAITSGAAVLEGKAVVITATGAGADTYTYLWSGAGTSGQTTASVSIASLSVAINATCTVTGTTSSGGGGGGRWRRIGRKLEQSVNNHTFRYYWNG